MLIEIGILIQTLGIAFVVYNTVVSKSKMMRSETESDTTQMTTVLVKLEGMGKDVTEIKVRMEGYNEEIRNIRERLIVVEKDVTALHTRVDDVEGR
jgi:hypothetical protein